LSSSQHRLGFFFPPSPQGTFSKSLTSRGKMIIRPAQTLPSPRNTRVPSPRDTTVPAPRNITVPAPGNTRVPSPRDITVPAPGNTRVPSPRNITVPAPRNTSVPSQEYHSASSQEHQSAISQGHQALPSGLTEPMQDLLANKPRGVGGFSQHKNTQIPAASTEMQLLSPTGLAKSSSLGTCPGHPEVTQAARGEVCPKSPNPKSQIPKSPNPCWLWPQRPHRSPKDPTDSPKTAQIPQRPHRTPKDPTDPPKTPQDSQRPHRTPKDPQIPQKSPQIPQRPHS
uniref:Uncharacterized protein n=1 Tax=Serinus canaria TaxID=9135 RepID=A0A8C9NBK3_SERCA